MQHISRTSNGNYIVAKVSDINGKVINTSEPLTRRRSAIVNVIADMKSDGVQSKKVQDNTGKKPVILWVGINGAIDTTDLSPAKPYVPKRKHVKALKIR